MPSHPHGAHREDPQGRALPPFLQGTRAFIWHYVRGRPVHYIALLLMVLAAASCAVGVQYVMKLLVDAMAGPRDNSAVWHVLWIFLGLIAIESVLWRLSGWLGCRTTIDIGVDMRLDLFQHLAGQPMRYFADNRAGSLGQRVTSTAGTFGALTNTIVWRVAPPCTDFFGALIVFTTIDWRMALALAGAVAVIMIGLIWFGERGRTLHRSYATQANEVGGDLVDVIANMWSVKAFSAQARERMRLLSGFRSEALAQRASWMYTEKARLIHDVALCVMAGAMLFWAIYLWSLGRITPGDVVVVSALTFRILHGSREMALALVDAVQQVGFIEDTLAVIGRAQAIRDAPAAPRLVVGRSARVQFSNVDFAYGNGRKAVSGLNLDIPPGQKLGIVGESGAGKSTIIHLLQRLYDVQNGEIRIEGQSISAVSQNSLRDTLAVVPQEITLFHRTVMENIRFAKPEASDEEVYAAARAAHCDRFIRALSDGYDTVVGERGTKLSGGQRQRVGIARAFLKPSPIILFDEATSALDTESERQIQETLIRVMHERTVIAVAHRLSTLTGFDRIIVVRDGQIEEDGSIAELLGRRGAFARMWRLQAAGLSTAGLQVDPTVETEALSQPA